MLRCMSAKTTPIEPLDELLRHAPIGECETDEERQMVAEARANFARHGRTRSPEQIAETIAAMRRKQEGE